MATYSIPFKRSLATALAMASFASFASFASMGAANAATLESETIQGGSTKSTALGTFGAGYDATFDVSLTNGALVGSAGADAWIKLFGTQMTIVDLSAYANINDSSAEGAGVAVEVVGQTVYEESQNDGFTFNAETDVNNYDDLLCIEFFDVSTTFTLVVVPITMSAGADGCANLTFSATPSYNTTTHRATIDMDLTPSANVDLTASVAAGTSAFSAGVEAEVTLLDLSVPISLDPYYQFAYGSTASSWDYESSGSITLNMLDGSLKAYAEADLGFWDIRYSTKIFSWDGISKTWGLWSTGKPTASDVQVTIEGATATGSYEYTDTANTPEGSTSFIWYRATDASGSGSTELDSDTSSSRTVIDADNGAYLKVCVTPRNNMSAAGTEQCSDWEPVGKVASFYEHGSYGGTNLSIAYQKATSGTCYNLEDYVSWFDNDASAYKLYAPSDSSATFHFYKAFNCSDTSSSEYTYKTVSAGGSSLQSSTSDLGSSWNDRLSSVMIVYNESVTADNVSVSISGNKATAAYTFAVGDSSNTTESGSTYVWYRASSSTGTGASTISGSTSSAHTLSQSDDRQYLKVCVTPSNGYTTGSQVCSDWTAVGHLLKLYEDSNYGGSQLAIAWEKSSRETCFNMTDYSFNDKISSYNWYNNAVSSSTVWFYKDANCTGTTATRTVSADSSEAVSSTSGTMGSAWQDSISSFKVSWASSVNIGTPTITIYGNKATESHTYSDSSGLAESATYTWYRASDSSGTSSTAITNALTNTYELDGPDNSKYLKVCVHSSNGVNVDEYEQCSSWVSVGNLLRLYAGSAGSGTDINVAYEKSTSGTCFNTSTFSFDDQTTSYWFYRAGSTSGTIYLYKNSDCSGSATTSSPTSSSNSVYVLSGTWDNAVSSFKIVY